jgi:hypothetical protein
MNGEIDKEIKGTKRLTRQKGVDFVSILLHFLHWRFCMSVTTWIIFFHAHISITLLPFFLKIVILQTLLRFSMKKVTFQIKFNFLLLDTFHPRNKCKKKT